jgi:hypothetical protein
MLLWLCYAERTFRTLPIITYGTEPDSESEQEIQHTLSHAFSTIRLSTQYESGY